MPTGVDIYKLNTPLRAEALCRHVLLKLGRLIFLGQWIVILRATFYVKPVMDRLKDIEDLAQ